MKKIFSIFKKDVRCVKPTILQVVKSFSLAERFLFFVVLWIFIISSIFLAWLINKETLVEIPTYGGEISEGVIGIPRFINPLIAISDTDRDMTMLIYSGLMRATNEGALIPDLAKKYEISEDGLEYTFTLKENIYFHDNTPVTADDIIFTISKTQDPALKSPKRASWDGVLVEKIDDTKIKFILNKPYSPFLENTTLGILPKHIWENASTEQFSFSQFNTKPIGSGPYKVKKIKRNSSGIPEYYDLVAFKKFALKKPYIKKIRINFYLNEEELIKKLNENTIESVNAISPKNAEQLKRNGYNILQSPLPRVFGLFFNQNQAPIFANLAVRKAINYTINKERIVNKVLYGYATVIDNPIPPGSLGYIEDEEIQKTDIERAKSILSKNGWSLNEDSKILEKKTKKETQILKFSISTSDIPELKDVAEIIKQDLSQIGIMVEVKVFETGDLNQNVIRPRKYDSLLFGEIIGRDSDLFAFWHSSQRNDPGLNIALYANINADKLLDEARTIADNAIRIEKYKKFQEEIKKDVPAVFIYAPNFIYILPEKIKGVSLGSTSVPSERFLNVYEWYINTDHVWKIFSN